jgi:hypothetical protein
MLVSYHNITQCHNPEDLNLNIFSFFPCTGKYFIGNVLCSADDFVMHLIPILHFFSINSALYKPQKKRSIEESYLENKGASERVSLFLSIDEETPCPERHEHNGRSEVVHQSAPSNWKTVPQEMMQSMLSQDTSSLFSDVCPNTSQICKLVLLGLDIPA